MDIKRAHTDFKNDVSGYTDMIIERIELIEEKGFPMFEKTLEKYKLGSFMSNTFSCFNEYCIIDTPNKTYLIKVIEYWKILAKAYYMLAYNQGKEVEVIFRDNPVLHTGKKHTGNLGFSNWLNSWSAFFVLRDREGVALMHTAPKEVCENADMKWDILDYNMFEIFRNIYNPAADIENILLEAMKSTDPESGHYLKEKFAIEYVLYNYEPLIRVYEALFRRDEQAFNEQLTDALQLHKTYWGTEKDNRNNDYTGWISWPLLGAAAAAHDFGMKLTVTSDYIPQWLVEGNFGVES